MSDDFSATRAIFWASLGVVFATLLLFFFEIGSLQNIIALFELAMALFIFIISFVVCTLNTRRISVFLILVGGFWMAVIFAAMIMNIIVLVFLCDHHEGCVESAIYYGIAIVLRAVLFIFVFHWWQTCIDTEREFEREKQLVKESERKYLSERKDEVQRACKRVFVNSLTQDERKLIASSLSSGESMPRPRLALEEE